VAYHDELEAAELRAEAGAAELAAAKEDAAFREVRPPALPVSLSTSLSVPPPAPCEGRLSRARVQAELEARVEASEGEVQRPTTSACG
jgi:hypothetical protein